jgi:heat shock protein HslJ
MKLLLKKTLSALAVGMLLTAFFACASQASFEESPPPEAAPGFSQVERMDWKLSAVRLGGADTGFSRDNLSPEFANSYTLRYQGGMAGGRGAPNTYRFPFEQGPDQSLSIQLGITTLMAPLIEPEGLQEHEYFGYLGRVYRWDIRDGNLELSTKSADGTEAVLVYSK